jgi:hypothetical protein
VLGTAPWSSRWDAFRRRYRLSAADDRRAPHPPEFRCVIAAQTGRRGGGLPDGRVERVLGRPSGRGSGSREGGKTIYKATSDAGVVNTAAAERRNRVGASGWGTFSSLFPWHLLRVAPHLLRSGTFSGPQHLLRTSSGPVRRRLTLFSQPRPVWSRLRWSCE